MGVGPLREGPHGGSSDPARVVLSPRRASPGRDATRRASVTLIRPPAVVPQLAITAPTCPPVGLAYLAGALAAEGHEVRVVDAVGEAPDRFVAHERPGLLVHGLTVEETVARVPERTDVVGVSCMFSHEWPQSRALLDALRARCPEALIVVGGEHATALPDLVLADCPAVDVVVLGEGEETVAEVVRAHSAGADVRGLAGCVVRTPGDPATCEVGPTRARVRAVDEMARPAWDLVPLRAYLDRGLGFGVHRGRSLPVVATRGCPYRCTFCSNPAMWTTAWVPRSPSDVLDEVEDGIERFGAENVDFYDLTFIVRRSWIVEFCELVIARGLRFTWQLPSGTRSEAMDAEVIDLLWRAGCRNLSYAPESGSAEVLDRILKKVDLDRMETSMRAAVRRGINCKVNIILGFPGETHAEVRRTLRYCSRVARVGVHDLSITPFSPYPGTALFEQLQAEGRIGTLDDDYFHSLLSYSDLSATVSHSAHIGDRALGWYRIAGIGAFYATSFLRRPWRVVALVRGVLRPTQESRLEMTLRDHLHRRRGVRAAARA